MEAEASGMSESFAVLIVFSLAVFVAMLTNKLKVSYTVALVCTGLGLSIAKNTVFPEADIGIHLTEELLFHILLPILIFEASYHIDYKSFIENIKWILHLAFTGLFIGIAIVTGLLVTVCGAVGIEFSWAAALLVGTIVAATDPVGVISALRSTRAPHRLTIVMEGESLLNDGVAVVISTVVFIYVGFDHEATISAPWLVKFVGWEIAGSFLLGAGVGYGVCMLLERVDDHMIEIALTTTAAFGSFLLAEELHASGVLSCLTAGMIVGNIGTQKCMNASAKMAVVSFWEYAVYVANSLVFLLIGLEIEIGGLISDLPAIVITWVIMLIGRAFFVWQICTLFPGLPKGYMEVIIWGGVRGGIAMVLALSIPESYEQRDLVLNCIFGASLLTILIQSTTIKPLLLHYNLISDSKSVAIIETLRAKIRSLHTARGFLEKQKNLGAISPAVYNQFNRQLAKEAESINQLRHKSAPIAKHVVMEEAKAFERHLLQVRKEDLSRASSDGAIDEDVGRQMVGELDERILDLSAH